MNVFFEVLNCLASLATVFESLLERWREYRHRRMMREEKGEPGGNQAL